MYGDGKVVVRVAGVGACAAACLLSAACAGMRDDELARNASGGRREDSSAGALERPAASPTFCPREGAVVLGACVTQAVADAYCRAGRPERPGFARMARDGCAFDECPSGRYLDLVTGACDSGQGQCEGGTVQALARVSVVCVSDDDACPMGTAAAYEREPLGGVGLPHLVCERLRPCPLGSIRYADRCLRVVGGRSSADGPRVDLGAWSTAVLGPNGGSGSSDLCRPLAWAAAAETHGTSAPLGRSRRAAQRPEPLSQVRLWIALIVPDEDVTRAHATVTGLSTPDAAAPRPFLIAAARASVDNLLELLRALGGQSSTAAAVSELTCHFAGARRPANVQAIAGEAAHSRTRETDTP